MYKEEIDKCIDILQKEGVILYPTDTIWGLGCDATSDKAVQKIFEVKDREQTKSLLILVSDFDMLRKYVKDIPSIAYDLVAQAQNPLTLIYPQARNLARYVAAEDGSIGIRIPKHEFCIELIRRFGKPIISTSANFSGELSPQNFHDISDKLKHKVDYIVNLFQEDKASSIASNIIKISNDNQFIKIR